MAAKKAKRMVWRISDIVGAVDPARRPSAEDACRVAEGDVPHIMGYLNVTLPFVTGTSRHVWNAMSDDERAAALVATAKRLRVPQVPA